MPTHAQSIEGKKLLLLDGSKKAIEIIDQAKLLGLYVIVSDYNSPSESPAKLAADEYFDVSTADVDAIVALIRRENISGVLPGFSDRWLPTYAEICEAAGLPSYASADQLRLFTDKKRYKRLLADHSIPTIEDFTLSQAISGEIPESSYPLMIKPSDGSGSRGISVCHSPESLQLSIAVAREYTWTDSVVIERYLPGQEATVYWVFQDGEYYVSLLWNRHMFNFGEGQFRLPVAYSSPSYLVPDYVESIAPRVREMLRSVGIRDGMMFMQGLVHDGVFYTYDIGYRITPTQEYRVIEALCGYNPLSMLLRFALTGSMGESELARKANPAHDGYGFNVSTLALPGTIGAFEGLERVADLPGVLSVSTSLREGDHLPDVALGELRQILVRTVGIAASEEDLGKMMQSVADMIQVRSAQGEVLTLGGFSSSELEASLL